MTDLYNGQMSDLIQNDARQNPEILSFSFALQMEKQRIMDFAQVTRTVSAVNQLPSEILDVLAIELRCLYYLESMDIDTKREMIRNCLVVYSKLGTKFAVEQFASYYFGNSQVQEWFEYGGQPHHFKVTSDNPKMVSENRDLFLHLLAIVKRCSSWLDSIEVDMQPIDSTEYVATAIGSVYTTRLPTLEKEFQFHATAYMGSCISSITQTALSTIKEA